MREIIVEEWVVGMGISATQKLTIKPMVYLYINI